MKSTRFTLPLLVSASFLLAPGLRSLACGAFNPSIPSVNFYEADYRGITSEDRLENLRLWQQLTSASIPPADIEQAVYRDSRTDFLINCCDEDSPNLFYRYINNTDDREIIEFLSTAKEMEEMRATLTSPWYYPRSHSEKSEPFDASDILRRCREYRGKRLRDRYALQYVRALFATRQYGRCIQAVDSAFAGFPDSNLFRRMAMRYAAGCRSRLGEPQVADSLFAIAGDVSSIAGDRLGLMCRLNPSAPNLTAYIRSIASDTVAMLGLKPEARRLGADPRVANRGDWNFLLAFINNEYCSEPAAARRNIIAALAQPFSSAGLRDDARAYKIMLDALTGNTSSLRADLEWIESKISPTGSDNTLWDNRLKHLVYGYLVPHFWKAGDYATAILLSGYADCLTASMRLYDIPDDYRDATPVTSLTLSEMRKRSDIFNPVDYGCLSFQLMQSLPFPRLAAIAPSLIGGGNALHRFLRRKARTDRDYIYELIGTVALRQEHYTQAVRYLSQVSTAYFPTTNVDKHGYLARDPFTHYPSRHEISTGYNIDWSVSGGSPRSNPGAKLDFARRMADYQRQASSAPSADDRLMARLMYAIGRRNSMEECWALTHYSRGYNWSVFVPDDYYYSPRPEGSPYAFLYAYDHRPVEARYDREIADILSVLNDSPAPTTTQGSLRGKISDETCARIHHILGNLLTVKARYSSTATALLLRTSCDNWDSWL